MPNVMLFLDADEAAILLAVAGKGISLIAHEMDAGENVAELAAAGAIYCKLLAEIEKAKEKTEAVTSV